MNFGINHYDVKTTFIFAHGGCDGDSNFVVMIIPANDLIVNFFLFGKATVTFSISYPTGE